MLIVAREENDAIVNLDDGDLLLTEVQGLPHTIFAVSHPGDKQEQTITNTKKTSPKIGPSRCTRFVFVFVILCNTL